MDVDDTMVRNSKVTKGIITWRSAVRATIGLVRVPSALGLTGCEKADKSAFTGRWPYEIVSRIQKGIT